VREVTGLRRRQAGVLKRGSESLCYLALSFLSLVEQVIVADAMGTLRAVDGTSAEHFMVEG